jgi:hypothetical protein
MIALLTFPALADDAGVVPRAERSGGPATQNLFTSDQARQHLMHLGYINVSEMTKDESGKWIGRATKDGKNYSVAVDVKGRAPTIEISPATN